MCSGDENVMPQEGAKFFLSAVPEAEPGQPECLGQPPLWFGLKP